MRISLEDVKAETGWLCLDFVNTVDYRAGKNPVELLNTYADLVNWAANTWLLTDEQAQHLLEQADRHPAEAAQVLEKAVFWREMLYRIVHPIADHHDPTGNDLADLNAALAEVMSFRHVIQTFDGYQWIWVSDAQALDPMLGPVIHSAAELLTRGDLERVKECADEMGCGWMFYDMSKNRSRRWCGMSGCGNRAKARRYYHRTHSTHDD